ncbi:hypothetical protein [Streptomyces sp. NPDC000931]|uniref:hypothetical protein n=1 Tax=Streptomyces sp. NPDC000931 TaxID=3154372 RepID=UPI003326D1C1
MDPIVVTAGSALVGAMATDGRRHAPAGPVKPWRVRPAEAGAAGGEPTDVRARVLSARGTGDTGTEQASTGSRRWRLHELLREEPMPADGLRRPPDETSTPVARNPAQAGGASTVTDAHPHGRPRLYVSGGDQRFHR